MSRRLVERVSRIVDRRGNRRGFLRSSAMTATALAVAPAAFALRPVSAEAAVITCRGFRCSPGALCCDGYTDFCCLLTGENLCPPGTVVAGWWKADGSGFCDLDGPRPRYYLDCNLVCDSACGCGWSGVCSRQCANADCRCPGGCDTRKVECTRFRYGQCNQDIKCVGPIACRVVTCVPPWQWDPNCTTTMAVDNVTRSHDRPCLHDYFTDVPPRASYAEAVQWLHDQDVIDAHTGDLYGPAEPLTRGTLAVWLWRLQGEPSERAEIDFEDVPEDSPHHDAVAWLVHAEITQGVAGGGFAPQRLVSRAQAVTFLHRLAGSPDPGPSIDYTDVPADAWHHDAANWAANNSIVLSATPSNFGASLSVNRGEAASMLYRFHHNMAAAAKAES